MMIGNLEIGHRSPDLWKLHSWWDHPPAAYPSRLHRRRAWPL